jgi:hypothetical protein
MILGNEEWNKKLKTIGLALFVAGLLVFLFNQGIEWKYNAQLLMEPCGACAQQNPEQEKCMQQCFAQPVQRQSPYIFNLTYLEAP